MQLLLQNTDNCRFDNGPYSVECLAHYFLLGLMVGTKLIWNFLSTAGRMVTHFEIIGNVFRYFGVIRTDV